MLGSPEGLVFSWFVVDIAEGMRSGLTAITTTCTHRPNDEGITRLIPASTAASTSACSLVMGFSSLWRQSNSLTFVIWSIVKYSPAVMIKTSCPSNTLTRSECEPKSTLATRTLAGALTLDVELCRARTVTLNVFAETRRCKRGLPRLPVCVERRRGEGEKRLINEKGDSRRLVQCSCRPYGLLSAEKGNLVSLRMSECCSKGLYTVRRGAILDGELT